MANFGKLLYGGSRPYYILESVEKLNNKKNPTQALLFASCTGQAKKYIKPISIEQIEIYNFIRARS